MNLSILFKTLILLSFSLFTPINIITTLPVIANTPVNTPTKTPQPKQFKLTLSGHSEPVRALTLSSNGQILASGSDDKTIKLWNPTTGALQNTLTGHTSNIKSIVITPNGETVISSSFDNSIKFWNTQTGKEIRTITEKSGVRAILLTPSFQK